MDVFDDDAFGVDATQGLRKLSRLLHAPSNKRKIASGADDDLPRKNELIAGVNSGGHVRDEIDDSDLEVYNKVKLQRAAKMATKAEIYSRWPACSCSFLPSTVPSLPESVVGCDGKRHISHQIEKNRGLTRSRNKKKKNPRKNYKEKSRKRVESWKGQVREHKIANGPYGEEAAGINSRITRSVRF